eukprot:GHVP01046717.1.p1 GENE.GHVP01046717.1~~GHVP01046717.1.p1  ORF type:complete len:746 (+),score=123.91 GHVP01046717.1:2385-4622(+)
MNSEAGSKENYIGIFQIEQNQQKKTYSNNWTLIAISTTRSTISISEINTSSTCLLTQVLQFVSINPPIAISIFLIDPKMNKIQHTLRTIYPDAKTTSISLKESSSLKLDQNIQYVYLNTDRRYNTNISLFFAYLTHSSSIKQPYSVYYISTPLTDVISIDPWTCNNLELIKNKNTQTKSSTLLSAVDNTSTSIGRDLLRRTLVAPPKDPSVSIARQMAVKHLLANQDNLSLLRKAIESTRDIGRAITVLASEKEVAEKKLRSILSIYKTILSWMDIGEIDFQDPLLANAILDEDIHKERLEELLELITENIDPIFDIENRPADQMNVFSIIKTDPDSILALTRRIYNETVNEIMAYKSQQEKLVKSPLRITITKKSVRLTTHTSALSRIKELRYLEVIRQPANISFTSIQLMKYNTRLIQTRKDIYNASNNLVSQLSNSVQEYIPVLIKLLDSVALLDLLSSFAKYAEGCNSSCPSFSNSTLSIKEGLFPVLKETSIIPSNIFLYPGKRFILIKGQNMSGKSVYLKQVALLTIMAYSGMLIPCESGVFPRVDKIFVRCGSDDDSVSGASTFHVEMRESSFILNNVTENSLVLLDELGRGTSTTDSFSLALAISERLLEIRCFVLFVCHVSYLDILLDYNGVYGIQLNRVLGSLGSGEVDGSIDRNKNYGIEAAKAVGISDIIIDKANKILNRIKLPEQSTAISNNILKEKYEWALFLKTLIEDSNDSSEERLSKVLETIQQNELK